MHFMMLVALPAEVAQEDVGIVVDRQLAPYDVDLEVEEITEFGDTYLGNPAGRWNWYGIGGRWSDHLKIRAGFDPADLVIGDRSWTNEDWPLALDRCDGGRLRSLDLEYVRAEAAEEAGRLWDEYQQVIAGTPQHRPVEEFDERAEEARRAVTPSWRDRCDRVDKAVTAELGLGEAALREMAPGSPQYEAYWQRRSAAMDKIRGEYEAELSYTSQQARADYHAQPRIAKLREHFHDPVEFYIRGLERAEFVRQRRQWAIHGAAFMTVDGRWLEPADDDDRSREGYRSAADAHLEALPDAGWLVVVDFHL